MNRITLLFAIALSLSLTAHAQTNAAPSAYPGQTLPVACSSPCTLSLAPGSAGKLSVVDATHYNYAAPASITAEHTSGGCLVSPNDSVFNTRIDALPVDPRSSTWIANGSNGVLFSFELLAGLNVIDNSVAPTPQTFHYTPAYNSSPNGYGWLIAPQPNHRESGSYAAGAEYAAHVAAASNTDHHLISVNKDTCQWFETYENDLPSPLGWTTASGWQYAGLGYPLSAYGTTDAAGLPLEALTLRPEEVLAGAVHHALRFTTNVGYQWANHMWPATANSSGQSSGAYMPDGARLRLKAGFVTDGVISVTVLDHGTYDNSRPRPTIAISGCAVAPVATEEDAYGSVGQIHVISNGSGCVNPQVVLTCAAPCAQGARAAKAIANMYSPAAQTILTALKRYGIMLADIGSNNAITTGSDVGNSPAVTNALWQVRCPDPTRNCQAATQPSGLTLTDFEVVDESGLMVSPGSSQVKPAYASGQFAVIQGGAAALPVALQPPVIQTPHTFLAMQAGSPAYAIPASVYPADLNQQINWTITSCGAGSGNCGSVVAGNLYLPAWVVAGEVDATLTGTAAGASANIYLKILPAGPLTIKPGNGFSDTLGGGQDIWFIPFVAPNGNYHVFMTFARGVCNAGVPASHVNLMTQDAIALSNYDYAACGSDAPGAPETVSLPAVVSNNLLTFGVFGATSPSGWDNQTSVTSVSFTRDAQ